MDKLSVLSIAVSTGAYRDFIDKIMYDAKEKRSGYICVANVHMLIEANRDPAFARVLERANVVTPDGMPLTWAMRLLHNIKQERVAGMDLLPDILQRATIAKLSVFFYGGTNDMLAQTREFIEAQYPNLNIAGTYSPPFRNLTYSEEERVAYMINASGSSIVFVSLGCPRQEKWMAAMKGRVHAEMIGIGGALPVMIGMKKRAPLWMQNSGLEWLYRFGQEPRRLFKRYAVTNSLFIMLLLKELIRNRNFRTARA